MPHIIMPCFQLCMNFATFEIARVKFPMSGVNLCTLHAFFPLSLKKGGKIIQFSEKKLGRLYSHVYVLKKKPERDTTKN